VNHQQLFFLLCHLLFITLSFSILFKLCLEKHFEGSVHSSWWFKVVHRYWGIYPNI